MKSRVLILILCFLLSSVACRRGTQTNVNESGSAAAGTTASNGDASQARTLIARGKELYRSDQDSEAAEAFNQALKLDPDLAEAYFRLGLAYEALNKQEEADAEYKKAIASFKKYFETNPDDAEAHYMLGQTYAGLRQYSEAVREYRQAVKLKKDDADIYYDLGEALAKLAQYDEAVTAFTKSLEIDPDNYRAEDALEEAREGAKRIKVGKKHQADLMKKQKEEELKKAGETVSPTAPSKPTPGRLN
jgi:tetratricopeptide (TPR) repeat protein